jgi:hypothetical protein
MLKMRFISIHNVALIFTLWLSLTTEQATAAPYTSQICARQPDSCSYTLTATDPSGNFAVYLVRVPYRTSTYAELVDLNEKTALNVIGSETRHGPHGSSDGITTRSAEFRLTRYGTTLATVYPSRLSFDLCGNIRPVGYLTRDPIELPDAIDGAYAQWRAGAISGSTIQFISRNGYTASVTIDEPVVSGTAVTSLLLISGGAQSGVVRVDGASGASRYFYPGGTNREEYFIQPDNRFSTSPNSFCEL